MKLVDLAHRSNKDILEDISIQNRFSTTDKPMENKATYLTDSLRNVLPGLRSAFIKLGQVSITVSQAMVNVMSDPKLMLQLRFERLTSEQAQAVYDRIIELGLTVEEFLVFTSQSNCCDRIRLSSQPEERWNLSYFQAIMSDIEEAYKSKVSHRWATDPMELMVKPGIQGIDLSPANTWRSVRRIAGNTCATVASFLDSVANGFRLVSERISPKQ